MNNMETIEKVCVSSPTSTTTYKPRRPLFQDREHISRWIEHLRRKNRTGSILGAFDLRPLPLPFLGCHRRLTALLGALTAACAWQLAQHSETILPPPLIWVSVVAPGF
jgi:hypothetical protein